MESPFLPQQSFPHSFYISDVAIHWFRHFNPRSFIHHDYSSTLYLLAFSIAGSVSQLLCSTLLSYMSLLCLLFPSFHDHRLALGILNPFS